MKALNSRALRLSLLMLSVAFIAGADFSSEVPLYGVFEKSVTNRKAYKNPFDFREVELETTFTSPSGRVVRFRGFYDGDKRWKYRFMPDETGVWKYHWRFSDRSMKEARGKFNVVAQGALKGVIRAYKKNPRWFAYNGNEPVFIKSYNISAGGFPAAPLEWTVAHVYRKFLEKGYNHLQLFVLPVDMRLGCTFVDGPEVARDPLFTGIEPSKTMNLVVWDRLEEHLGWLNDHGIAVHFFKGFDGKDKGPRLKHMSKRERESYVRYATARLAAFSNICGWNFTWETQGDRMEPELMGWLKRDDPWEHLRTYHDEYPLANHYSNPLYTFAAIENKGFLSPAKGSLSHHLASLRAYQGKPVLMSEGNGLWMWAWGANEDEIRRAAWGTTMAGASFSWNDLTGKSGECVMTSSDIFHSRADEYLDILYRVLTKELVFYRMKPREELLSGFTGNAYLLAEKNEQYLVYLEEGGSVTLDLSEAAPTSKFSVNWVDPKSGRQEKAPNPVQGGDPREFSSPFKGESVLMLRSSSAHVSV